MGDGFLEGLDNFSETKVIGVVFIGEEVLVGAENLEGVKHESGLVAFARAGGAVALWSGYGGIPSAWRRIIPAAIMLSNMEWNNSIELIMQWRIINGSGRDIKYPAPDEQT